MSSLPATRKSDNTPAPRRDRIGSGDIASILGLPDAFGSPYSVWVAKTTGEEPEMDEKTKARLWWGEKLEPAILDRYAILSPGHEPVPRGRQRHFVSSDHPFLTATVDDIFIFEGEHYVLEAKLSHIDVNDGLPFRVQAQIQWHMGMSGIRRGVAAVLFFTDIGRDVQIWDIDFDPDVFRALKNAALMFWMRNVRMGIPPKVDGHKATTAALKRIRGVDRAVDISHLADVVQQYGQVGVAEKSLKKTKAELSNRLKFELDTATCGQINGKDAITWRPDKNGTRSLLLKKAFQPKGLDDE